MTFTVTIHLTYLLLGYAVIGLAILVVLMAGEYLQMRRWGNDRLTSLWELYPYWRFETRLKYVTYPLRIVVLVVLLWPVLVVLYITDLVTQYRKEVRRMDRAARRS